jgi:hypothetical protein
MLAVLSVATLACNVPKPLTYPLTLTPARDATTEIRRVIGQPTVQRPGQLAQAIAARLSGKKPGCEVFVVARVIWVSGGEPARAAIESRGTCDDSVQGAWYEVTMEGDDQAGWVVSAATKADICRRGISGNVCV